VLSSIIPPRERLSAQLWELALELLLETKLEILALALLSAQERAR
jgi:hypothetical protein